MHPHALNGGVKFARPAEETHKTFKEAAEDQEIKLARSTLKRITHDHRDDPHPRAIVRAAQQQKLLLTPDNMERRYECSLWALARLNEDAIFVFSDEDYHYFGGLPHKKTTHNPDERRAKRGICRTHSDSPILVHALGSLLYRH